MINRRLTLVAGAAVLFATPLAAQTAAPAAPAAAEDSPIAPDRLAAGEKVAAQLVPPGTYLGIMRNQFPKMMDVMMARMGSMKASDLGLPSNGDAMADARKRDPAFEERMRITTRVMSEEMGKVMGELEPRVRTGLGRALARKFTAAQLADLGTFFATPSGSAFARGYLALMADPEMAAEMAAAAPVMMKAMPDMMLKVGEATKHLPPPPKPDAKE